MIPELQYDCAVTRQLLECGRWTTGRSDYLRDVGMLLASRLFGVGSVVT